MRPVMSENIPTYHEWNGSEYLELHAEHTLWKVRNENLSDDAWGFLVDDAWRGFQYQTGVEPYLLGRSGRHFCIADTPENRARYDELREIALAWESELVEAANAAEDESAKYLVAHYG